MERDSLPPPPPPPASAQHARRDEDAGDQQPVHELAQRLYAERRRTIEPRATERQGKKKDPPAAQLAVLSSEIETLTLEIERLTQSRDLLVSQRLHRFDDLDGSSVKVVVEYFRVFQRGLILSPVDAVTFLETVMAEQVQINSFIGRRVVIEQWKTHSMCWNDIDIQLVDTTVIPVAEQEATVQATATFTLTISRLALAVVFPHILQSQHIVKRLLGRKLVGHARQDFVYRRGKKQFVRLVAAIDFIPALAKLLPDPIELSLVLTNALLTDEFYIGEIDTSTIRIAGSSGGSQGRGNEAPLDEEEMKQDVNTGSMAPRAQQDKMRLDHIL